MYKNKEILKTLSKLAADSYLRNKTGSLRDEIVKVARQESVSPVQIGFMTAEANQQVWKSLYDLDKKSSYSFEPVDPKHVIDHLQKEGNSVTKTASVSEDYLTGPSEVLLEEHNFRVQTYGMDKVATDRRELKQALQKRLEKMALAKEQLEGRELVAESAVEATESRIVKEAKQMLMEVPFSDRPAGLEKIAEFVRAAMLPKKKAKEAARLIVKISNVLKSQGLVKSADLKAPAEYISESLPARVINGRHPLYVHIDTLVQKWDELAQIRQGREIVDSSLPIVKEKIRGL